MKSDRNLQILVMVIGLTFGIRNAYSQGIEFLHLSYEEACEKAAKEKKNLFFDIYTTWCGPCKIMDRTVFSQKEAGDYYNSHFISIKLDAEKEADSGFFKHYKATAYPTFFWLDPEGNLLDTKTGVLPVDGLIEIGKAATQTKLGEKAKDLEKRWQDGERSFSLLQEYAFGVLQVSDPRKTKSVVEDYIKGLSDEEKRSIQSFSVIRPFIKARGAQAFPDSYLFNTFVENIEHYASQMDAKMIETGNFWHTLYLTFVRMPSLLYRNANAGRGNMETYTQAVQQLKSMNLPLEDIFIECLKAEEAFSDKAFEKGILKTKAILDQHGATYPILYSSLLYSMTYAGYFLEGDQLHGDTLLSKRCTGVPLNDTVNSVGIV